MAAVEHQQHAFRSPRAGGLSYGCGQNVGESDALARGVHQLEVRRGLAHLGRMVSSRKMLRLFR